MWQILKVMRWEGGSLLLLFYPWSCARIHYIIMTACTHVRTQDGWMDTLETWYGHYAIGGCSKLVLFRSSSHCSVSEKHLIGLSMFVCVSHWSPIVGTHCSATNVMDAQKLWVGGWSQPSCHYPWSSRTTDDVIARDVVCHWSFELFIISHCMNCLMSHPSEDWWHKHHCYHI